jgi:hypothetical protein
MNDLTKKEAPDRSKINLHDPLQAKAWSHELGVIIERLIELVEKVGNSAAGVRKKNSKLRKPSAWRNTHEQIRT